jgi:iron complex outermembrane receptor protein
MFNVKNFYGVEDNRISLFAHLDRQLQNSRLGLGVRIKHNSADADRVSHHMAMMNPNIKALRDGFNQADRSQSEVNVDLVANWTRPLSEHSQIVLGAAIKQKAPSYQERYLWVPMQATGGLADGRTYIGNMELDSETAYQLNAGFSLQEKVFGIAPSVFYQHIDDYIQGTPSSNMAANMVSNMMSGSMPLQFTNVDAELYGLDMTARYNASASVVVTGVASYVRGKRKDIDDDLYRISAPNLKLNATYYADEWQASLGWQVFAKQDKVSTINTEHASAGYGLVNLAALYFIGSASVEVGVNNLFDKHYHDHIAGTNRVAMSQIELGDKLPGTGRDLFIKLGYQF